MLCRELNHSKCKTYLVACENARTAVVIDPVREKVGLYLGALAYFGLRLEMIIDTHTHADHRSGARDIAEITGAALVMHRKAPSPHVNRHVEGGERLRCGNVELEILHTPGHTPDSISVHVADRVFTGDALLIHGTGRADFAGGDPGEEYDGIVGKLFKLPDSTIVLPAHDYRGHTQSTIGEEKRSNPRIAGRTRAEYINLMNNLNLALPQGIQEALQPNESDLESDVVSFPTYAQLNAVHQLAPADVRSRLDDTNPPILVDVRENEEYRGELGHIVGARLIPLGELADRAPRELADAKDREMVVICRSGMRSTTGAAMLTGMGFERVWNLKGGMLEWNDAGLPIER